MVFPFSRPCPQVYGAADKHVYVYITCTYKYAAGFESYTLHFTITMHSIAFWFFSSFFFNFCFLHKNSFAGESYEDGTLKWKSHDTTKANTIQARRKFRKRWPCQKLRDSVDDIDAETAAVAEALLASDDCSVNSTSLAPTTLRAIEWQISQVLHKIVERIDYYIQMKKKNKKTNLHNMATGKREITSKKTKLIRKQKRK